jgi:hypothetical protein
LHGVLEHHGAIRGRQDIARGTDRATSIVIVVVIVGRGRGCPDLGHQLAVEAMQLVVQRG